MHVYISFKMEGKTFLFLYKTFFLLIALYLQKKSEVSYLPMLAWFKTPWPFYNLTWTFISNLTDHREASQLKPSQASMLPDSKEQISCAGFKSF